MRLILHPPLHHLVPVQVWQSVLFEDPHAPLFFGGVDELAVAGHKRAGINLVTMLKLYKFINSLQPIKMRSQCYFILLLVAVCMGATLVVNGQFGAIETIRHRTGSMGMTNIKAADFDGDGQDEVLGVYKDELVYFKFENGEIAEEILLVKLDKGISSYIIMDEDLDGDLDILVLSRTSQLTELIMLNNVNGNFDDRLIHSGTIFMHYLSAAADLIGDGMVEIVCRDFNTIYIFSRDEEGLYEITSSFVFSEFPVEYDTTVQIEPKDMDQDGLMDLIVLYNSNINTFRNLGNLNFELSSDPHMLNKQFDDELIVRQLHIADLAETGAEDFIVLSRTQWDNTDQHCNFNVINRFHIFTKNEQNGFDEKIIAFPLSEPITTLHIGDLNADGKKDIITPRYAFCYKEPGGNQNSYVRHIIKVHQQLDSLDYNSQSLLTSFNTYTHDFWNGPTWSHFMARSTAYGDITGNGHKDLIFAPGHLHDYGTAPFSYFENQGEFLEGTFEYHALKNEIETTALVGGDFTGDGQYTLIQAALKNGETTFIEHPRTGPESYESRIIAPAEHFINKEIVQTASGDVNGDGRDDLVYILKTIEQPEYTLHILFSDEYGMWTEPFTYANTSSVPLMLATSNLQGDEKDEIIICKRGQEDFNVAVLSYQNETLYPLSMSAVYLGLATSLKVADIDGNGYPDISVLGNSGVLRLLLNNGNSTYEPVEIELSSVPLQNLQHLFSDIDGDGFDDLITWAEGNQSPLLWHKNLGQINFESPQVIMPAGSYRPVVDTGKFLEGNNYQLVVLPNNNKLTVFNFDVNTDSLFAVDAYRIASGKSRIYMAVNDFTGDGMDDIAFSTDRMSIHRDSRLRMAIPETPPRGDISGLVFIDENGNGILDPEELPASTVRIASASSGDFAFSNSDGLFELKELNTGIHELFVDLDLAKWQITTATEDLVAELVQDDNYSVDNLKIGIKPNQIVDQVDLDFTSSQLPCTGHSTEWITVTNRGNHIFQGGSVYFTLPNSLEIVGYSPINSSESVDIYKINIPEINATQHITRSFKCVGFENIPDGTEVEFITSLRDLEGNVLQESKNSHYTNCIQHMHMTRAESGWTNQNFVVKGDSLEYTFLFEISNEPVDKLIAMLPSKTKRESILPIAWSEEPMLFTSNTGSLHVQYDSLDSTGSTSHFFRFRIQQEENLEPGDKIFQDFKVALTSGVVKSVAPDQNTIFSCEGLAEFEIDNADPLCEGVDISASSEKPWIVNYSWILNGESVSEEQFLDIEQVDLGVYDLQLNIYNPICEDQFATTLEIHALPEPPQIFQIDGELFVENSYSDYQWHLDGSPIEDANESNFHPAMSGNYSVIVSDKKGCKAETQARIYDDNWTSLTKDEAIKIFPNPADNSFFISSVIGLSEDARLWIMDTSGRSVYSQILNENGLTVVQTSGLTEGVYILQIKEGNDVVATRKQVIAR